MNCKICESESKELFEGRILNKYDIKYYQCTKCDFIQTEEPYWLDEAYENAIADTDLGYITRNVMHSEILSSIITIGFNKSARFIDFGGGYGMFGRLMRNRGYDFYRQDTYCENLFLKYFDINDIDQKDHFELLTAYEVFEHLPEPMVDIQKMMGYSDSILFSTEIQGKEGYKSFDDWWYFTPETGQHVALYSRKTLEYIAEKFNLNLYSNNRNLHLLTKKKFILNPVTIVFYFHKIIEKLTSRHFFNKKSLLESDMKLVKSKLKNS